MSSSVFVSNISPELTEDNLRDLFSECGTIQSLTLIGSENSRVCRVDFQLSESVLTACALSGTEIGNRSLNIVALNEDAPEAFSTITSVPSEDAGTTPASTAAITNAIVSQLLMRPAGTGAVSGNILTHSFVQEVGPASIPDSWSKEADTHLANLPLPPPPFNSSSTPNLPAVLSNPSPSDIPSAIPAIFIEPPTDAASLALYDEYRRQEEVSRTVYVGNLSKGLLMEQLKSYFSNCGPIVFVRITENQSRFGFIEFTDHASARNAIKLHGTFLLDRALVVRPSNSSITKSSIEHQQAKESLMNLYNARTEKIKVEDVRLKLLAKSSAFAERIANRISSSSAKLAKTAEKERERDRDRGDRDWHRDRERSDRDRDHYERDRRERDRDRERHSRERSYESHSSKLGQPRVRSSERHHEEDYSRKRELPYDRDWKDMQRNTYDRERDRDRDRDRDRPRNRDRDREYDRRRDSDRDGFEPSSQGSRYDSSRSRKDSRQEPYEVDERHSQSARGRGADIVFGTELDSLAPHERERYSRQYPDATRVSSSHHEKSDRTHRRSRDREYDGKYSDDRDRNRDRERERDRERDRRQDRSHRTGRRLELDPHDD